jgi:hypothetical protein
MPHTDPSHDKTNPKPEFIHQEFDDDPYDYVHSWDGDDMSEGLAREKTILRDFQTEVNNTDDAFEASRNRDDFHPDHDTLSRYPDEFIRNHTADPKDRQELARNQESIMDFYSSETELDIIGTENEPDQSV